MNDFIKINLNLLLTTVLLFILVQPVITQNTFTEIHNLQCRDTLLISGLGFPTWATAEIISPPKYGYAKIEPGTGFQTMQYIAPPCFKGSDTIVVSCAKATQLTCDTGIYIINIDCAEEADQVEVYNIKNCDDSINTYVSGFANAQITEGPLFGTVRFHRGVTDLDTISYFPDSLYAGMDFIKLSLFNNNQSGLLIYHIDCKISTSTKESKKFIHNIYPNPVASDVLHIPTVIESLQKLYLINSMGNSICGIYEQANKKIILDIKDLSNGWYAVVLASGTERQYERFLILR